MICVFSLFLKNVRMVRHSCRQNQIPGVGALTQLQLIGPQEKRIYSDDPKRNESVFIVNVAARYTRRH